jgi:hypothetical protein
MSPSLLTLLSAPLDRKLDLNLRPETLDALRLKPWPDLES